MRTGSTECLNHRISIPRMTSVPFSELFFKNFLGFLSTSQVKSASTKYVYLTDYVFRRHRTLERAKNWWNYLSDVLFYSLRKYRLRLECTKHQDCSRNSGLELITYVMQLQRLEIYKLFTVSSTKNPTNHSYLFMPIAHYQEERRWMKKLPHKTIRTSRRLKDVSETEFKLKRRTDMWTTLRDTALVFWLVTERNGLWFQSKFFEVAEKCGERSVL